MTDRVKIVTLWAIIADTPTLLAAMDASIADHAPEEWDQLCEDAIAEYYADESLSRTIDLSVPVAEINALLDPGEVEAEVETKNTNERGSERVAR